VAAENLLWKISFTSSISVIKLYTLMSLHDDIWNYYYLSYYY